MLQTRGCGCNAGRALPRAGRERSKRVAHSRFFGRQGGEEKIVPSPGRVRDAATPALLIFWNLPQAEARGRMGGEERRGRGRGAAATRWAPAAPRGGRAAAAIPTAQQARVTRVGTAASGSRASPTLPTPRPSLRARIHLTWVAFPHRL